MPPLTRVTRVVYKATLRAVAKLEANARGDLGLVLGAERVTLGHPNIDLRSAVQPHDDAVTQPAHLCDNLRIVVPREAEGLTHRVRSAYRAGGHSCVDRMDAALALLAELNAAATALECSEECSSRSCAAPFVLHRVGEVVEVLPGGRRGVVVGWDPVCQAGEAFVRASPHPSTRSQPHYVVLLDNGAEMVTAAVEAVKRADVTRRARAAAEAGGLVWEAPDPALRPTPTLPSAANSVAYAPQEAVRPCVGLRPSARLLLHPLLGEYFQAFDPATGVYVLTPQLEALYPLDGYASSPLLLRVARRLGAGGGGGGGGVDPAALLADWGGGSGSSQGAPGLAPASRRARPWVPTGV